MNKAFICPAVSAPTRALLVVHKNLVYIIVLNEVNYASFSPFKAASSTILIPSFYEGRSLDGFPHRPTPPTDGAPGGGTELGFLVTLESNGECPCMAAPVCAESPSLAA